MTGTGSGYVSVCWEHLLSRYGLMFTFAIFLVATGSSTTGGLSGQSEAEEPAMVEIVENEQAIEFEQAVEREKAVQKELAAQIAQLESREKELERQIRLLANQPPRKEGIRTFAITIPRSLNRMVLTLFVIKFSFFAGNFVSASVPVLAISSITGTLFNNRRAVAI